MLYTKGSFHNGSKLSIDICMYNNKQKYVIKVRLSLFSHKKKMLAIDDAKRIFIYN